MSKSTKILLIIAILLIGSIGLFKTSIKPAQKGTPVFSCILMDKQSVIVTAEGNQLHFTFGDIRIIGDAKSGNVAYHHEIWSHAEDKHLRFRQGDNSYVLFNRWAAPNDEGNSAISYSGLLIFKGYDKIDLKFCHDSGQFLSDFDLTTLPDDAENVIPEQEVSEASIDDVLEGLDRVDMVPGAYRDEHDCIPSAGYEWSETKPKCVRPWLEEDENTGQADNDETVHETGLVIAVEDGPYPMYSITMEFAKAQTRQSFSLNVEHVNIDVAALNKAVGQHVSFDYTSELDFNLIELKLNGKPLLNGSINASLKQVTGILSGAASITGSDLPGQVTITDKAGNQVHFPYYVEPAMVVANGKQVTAYYETRTNNTIVKMELK